MVSTTDFALFFLLPNISLSRTTRIDWPSIWKPDEISAVSIETAKSRRTFSSLSFCTSVGAMTEIFQPFERSVAISSLKYVTLPKYERDAEMPKCEYSGEEIS